MQKKVLKIGKIFLMVVIAFLIILTFLIKIFSFPFSTLKLHGPGMEPNYKDGQNYIVNTIIYSLVNPGRGDVVEYKGGASKNTRFMQRIIGLPGEEIKIIGGSIYINGELLSEDYLSENTYTESKSSKYEEGFTIPENEYFMLGDNRSSSYDSRDIGTIKKEDIVGKVTICYWNCS